MKHHLNEDRLIKYRFKLLSEAQAQKALMHLGKCWRCRQRLQQIEQKFAALDLLKEDIAAPESLISKTLTQAVKAEPVGKSYFLRPAWISAAR